MRLKTIKTVEDIVLIVGGLAAASASVYGEIEIEKLDLLGIGNLIYTLEWILWIWVPYGAFFGLSSWLHRVKRSLQYSFLTLGVAILMLGFTLYKYSYVLNPGRGGLYYNFMFLAIPVYLLGIVIVAITFGAIVVETLKAKANIQRPH